MWSSVPCKETTKHVAGTRPRKMHMLFTGREACIKKNCVLGLEYSTGRTQFSPIRTDLDRLIGHLFFPNICEFVGQP